MNLCGNLFRLGILSLLLLVLDRYMVRIRERGTRKTTAKVIRYREGKPDNKGSRGGVHTYYYPVVEYYVEGLLYEAADRNGGYPPPKKINEQVMIRYLIAKPSKMKILNFWERYQFQTILLSILTTGLFGASVIFYILFATRG